MEKETEAEIKSYLKFIRNMGIKVWIPGSPGNDPKMSVTDQCRSGVLCLNYKGTEIYIQGNSRCVRNDKSSTGVVKNLDLQVKFAGQLENDTLDQFDGDLGDIPVNDNLDVNITSPAVVGILEIDKLSKSPSRFEKSVEKGVNRIENKTFVPEITGMQFKRIIREKLTREVRVAKCYVSSLPEIVLNYNSNCNKASGKNVYSYLDKKSLRLDYTGKLWSSLDCKRRLVEIEKSGLSPGFVRQLIKKFDVYDNVEQQCPIQRNVTDP